MNIKKVLIYLASFLLGALATLAIATIGFEKFGDKALLIPLIVTFSYFLIFFIIAQIIKDNSIVDMGWGLGFVIGSWTTLLNTSNPSVLSYIIVLFISLWGIRLSARIIKRNYGKPEDFRYAQWRKDWGKNACFIAFFRVFMLQGILNFIVGSASYSIIKFNEFKFNDLSVIFVIVGLFISFTGLFFEVVGDEQLRRHINKKNGKILDKGLWSITRHPNYFGEISIWTGLYIVGLSLIMTSSINPVFYLILLISPALMSTVLLKISTPLLEKSMSKYDGWADYTKRTPMIFPFFGRKR